MNSDDKTPRCQAKVWKRDCLRRTGRGKSGFEMHYEECQCRRAGKYDGRCWQHRDKTMFRSEAPHFRYLRNS
jgi:hypothetical protein